MAVRTILRRRLVKQHRFVLDLALQRVTHCTTDICVRPCQGKRSALIVVERGRRPALVHMAVSALGYAVFSSKLARVRIGVAAFAILGRSLELNLVRIGGHFVTLVTCNRSMTPEQRKFCF